MKSLKDMSIDEIIESLSKIDDVLAAQDRLIKTYEDGFKRMDAIERQAV